VMKVKKHKKQRKIKFLILFKKGAKEKEQKIMETVHKYMKTCPATKNEIESLNARIRELEKKLADIEGNEQRKKPEKQS